MVEAQIHKKKGNVTHFVTLHWTYSRKEMGEAQVERKKISRYQLGFLDTWGRGAQRHYRSAPSTPVEICTAPWHFLPHSYYVLNSVGIIPFQFICLKICCIFWKVQTDFRIYCCLISKHIYVRSDVIHWGQKPSCSRGAVVRVTKDGLVVFTSVNPAITAWGQIFLSKIYANCQTMSERSIIGY